MAKIFGVDFSHWQANVNFEKLVANDVRFAIFKAGEIPTKSKKEFTDPKFARNIGEARKYNIISGAYYYFHPSIGASRQARHFDAVMQRDGVPDLPPVIDVEDTDQRSPVQVADVLKAMIDALMSRGYRQPIIYSRWGFLVNQVGEPFWLKDHCLWLAQYSNELIYKPADMSNVIMWQFTDRLKLPGVGVALDGNYWLKSEAELFALVRKPAAVIEEPPIAAPVLPPVVEPIMPPPTMPDTEFEPEIPDEIIPAQSPSVVEGNTDDIPSQQPAVPGPSPQPSPVPPVLPEYDMPAEQTRPAEEIRPPAPSAESFWQFIRKFLRAFWITLRG